MSGGSLKYGLQALLAGLAWGWAAALSAGPAVPFGGWVVNSGTIDTDPSCQDPNVVCKVLIQEDGFLQELVDTGTGGLYIRTVVTDPGASGVPGNLPFEMETFVPLGDTARNTWGVDFKVVVNEAASGFNTTALYDQDPFVTAAGENLRLVRVDINQSLNGPNVQSDFTMMINSATGFADPANDAYGKTLDIDTLLALDDPNCDMMNSTCDPNWQLNQQFIQRDREGLLVDVFNDTLNITPITTQSSMSLDPSVPVVSWNDGDAISTHWIAQADNQGSSSTTMNYQSVTNKDALVDPFADYSSTTDVPPLNPFAWDANFGPPPPSLP